MTIGDNLKNARVSVGMTQKELAEKLGVYPKDICRWETGVRVPGADKLAAICRALNVSADDILGL